MDLDPDIHYMSPKTNKELPMIRHGAGARVFLAGHLFVATAAFVLGGASCSSTKQLAGVAQHCSLNSECDQPLVCVFTLCHNACNTSVDCPSGERCVPSATPGMNVCQLPKVEATCAAGSTCSIPGEVCGSDSQCRPSCTAAKACQVSGTTCLAQGEGASGGSACVDPYVAPDQPIIDAGGSEAGAGPDASMPDSGGAASDATLGDASAGDANDTGTPEGNTVPEATPSDSMTEDGTENTRGEASLPGLSCADGGTGLAAFHPSNLPVPLVVPDAGGTYTLGTSCTFDTDSLTVTNNGLCPGASASVVKLSDGREAAVWLFDTFTLTAGQTLTITGSRPAIVAANETVEINGLVNSSGSRLNGWAGGGAPGPNAFQRAGICPLDTSSGGGHLGGNGSGSGLGAGGGGFCGTGGHGSTPVDGGIGAVGGTPYGTETLIPLVGGSSGGSTDHYTLNNHGGGAIEFVAGTSVTVTSSGTINMGGGAGAQGDDGNAGGSGGSILLEAPSVEVRGVVAANGAAGAGFNNSGQGGLGSDQAAQGSFGGAGGAGATSTGADGQIGTFNSYSGGGGGVGRIRINTGCGGTLTIPMSAVISPYKSTGCYTNGTLQ
jgi:hypothetical protein